MGIILNGSDILSNWHLNFLLTIFAFMRIFWEFLPVSLESLPLTRYLYQGQAGISFHRFGLIMAIGHLFCQVPYWFFS